MPNGWSTIYSNLQEATFAILKCSISSLDFLETAFLIPVGSFPSITKNFVVKRLPATASVPQCVVVSFGKTCHAFFHWSEAVCRTKPDEKFAKQKPNRVLCVCVMSRASFCYTKKLKILHVFLTKVAKSCIYAQTLKTTVVYSNDLLTYNAKYLQTLLREKWRSFASSLHSMLKLSFTAHVVSELLRHR